jgi:hypothetical protein
MKNCIHPYWILAAVAIGIPTVLFYYETVKPIAEFFKSGSVLP